jgi:hypothetical protein
VSCGIELVQSKLVQLTTASFFPALKGEASRYIFLTKFRKFLQENASGRGVGILQAATVDSWLCCRGYALGFWHLSAFLICLPFPDPFSAAFPSLPKPGSWGRALDEEWAGLWANTNACFVPCAYRTCQCSAPLSTWSASCTG